MDFKNKNVVITGGSTGIGLATAKQFIEAGAKVWITSRSETNLQQAADELNNSNLTTLVADTSDMEGIAALTNAIAAQGEQIDVLFLNAGIARFTSIEQATEADFNAQFNTNVKGHFFTLQKLIPHLKTGASVIFTSSIVATAAGIGTSVYSATKGALNKIAQIAANELADRKIRVNIISPGPVQTPGMDTVANDDAKAHLASGTAQQRLGDAPEIAATVLFLASDAASFISGTEIIVDGGYLTYATK